MNNKLSFGSIESIKDKRTITSDDIAMVDATLPPEEFEILLNYPRVRQLSNQRKLGICTACATRVAVEDAFAVAKAIEGGSKESIRINEYWLYLMGKTLVDGNLTEGSSALTMLKTANKYGVLSLEETADYPLNESGSYAQFISDFKKVYGGKIPQKLLDLALKRKIEGYYKVNVDPVSIAKEISKGKPVIARFVVGDNTYKDIKGNVSWNAKDLSPLRPPRQIDGGHLWCITGYKGLTEKQEGKIINSWSNFWCEDGYIRFIFETQKPYFTEAWCVGAVPKQLVEERKVNDFKVDLQLGVTHSDVKKLQVFLNNNGFTISPIGKGSKGKETDYFGKLTQLALIRFQLKYNIKPARGYFGKVTRGIVNAIK